MAVHACRSFSSDIAPTRHVCTQGSQHICCKETAATIARVHCYLEPLQRLFKVLLAGHPQLDDLAQVVSIDRHEIYLHSRHAVELSPPSAVSVKTAEQCAL